MHGFYKDSPTGYDGCRVDGCTCHMGGTGKTLRERVAKTLKWDIKDTMSMSWKSLAALVRPNDRALADEIIEMTERGEHITNDRL
jgi:hypothetical protein